MKENPELGIEESISVIEKKLEEKKKEFLDLVLIRDMSDKMPEACKQLHLSCLKSISNVLWFRTYYEEYFDNSSSEGFLASESFTFDSSSSTQKETVQNVVFGCGFDPTNMGGYGDEGNIAGVLAMEWDSHSLSQLGSRAQGRFSYCL